MFCASCSSVRRSKGFVIVSNYLKYKEADVSLSHFPDHSARFILKIQVVLINELSVHGVAVQWEKVHVAALDEVLVGQLLQVANVLSNVRHERDKTIERNRLKLTEVSPDGRGENIVIVDETFVECQHERVHFRTQLF